MTPTTVNFFAVGEGDITPFIAFINDETATLTGSSFTFLAIGDVISVGSNAQGTLTTTNGSLVNSDFTVGGASTSFTANADGRIVAGFLSEGVVISNGNANQGATDFVGNGDGLTG